MAVAEETKAEERETTAVATTANVSSTSMAAMKRREKRKALKKMKRKQLRREKAIKEREEEETRLNDPEVKMRLLRLEQEENERMEKDRREFEEREKRFVMELERKMKERELEEEAERNRKVHDQLEKDLVDNEKTNGLPEDDEWEYVEEGPAEIIWKGNEIIVKKKKVKVPKKGAAPPIEKQESERPISNPLAPQSEAYEEYRSAQEVLASVAQQVPNFGTEQDKAHCPFNLKTGVCRFGARCSRVHFYPDKSCTLLMKNMYNGPGLAYEQDEGLEHTDEEVERSFEDFYEDVHTEFLKFGEIVNFKVCKNASSHLRGNVYVHYRLLDSAVLAYQSINGRFFAGKQISCEFVNLTKWKVAICGEYMRSRFKTCSRGSACNFIHCFRNPGGDYEWADLDKPAPRYWLEKMASLFGRATDQFSNECSPGSHRSRRSRSGGSDGEKFSDEDDDRRRGYPRKRRVYDRGASYRYEEMLEDRRSSYDHDRTKNRKSVTSDISDRDTNDSKISANTTKSSGKRERDSDLTRRGSKSRRDGNYSDRRGYSKDRESGKYREHNTKSSGSGKDYNFYLKENPNVDMCGDKQHINKGRDSLPRRKKEKSLDINSDEDRLDRDKDKYHRHSKKSSIKTKKEAELSDSDSHGGSLFRDEKKYRKDRKKVSRSRSEIADTDSDREKLNKGEKHRRHRRKSSKYHSKDKLTKADYDANRCSIDRDKPDGKEEEKDLNSHANHVRNKNHHANLDENPSEKDKVDGISETSSFQEDNVCRYSKWDKFQDSCTEDRKSYREQRSKTSNERNALSHEVEAADRKLSPQDSYRQSETELEQAYRLAALKKLEELKKSKDTSVKYREQDETMVTDSCDHDNLSRGTEIGHGSSKEDRTAASVKRRRI